MHISLTATIHCHTLKQKTKTHLYEQVHFKRLKFKEEELKVPWKESWVSSLKPLVVKSLIEERVSLHTMDIQFEKLCIYSSVKTLHKAHFKVLCKSLNVIWYLLSSETSLASVPVSCTSAKWNKDGMLGMLKCMLGLLKIIWKTLPW